MIEKNYDRIVITWARDRMKSEKAVKMLNYDYPECARFRVIFRDGVQTLKISDIVELYDCRFIDRIPLSDLGYRYLLPGDKFQTYDPLIKSHRPNTIIIRVS